VGKIDKDPNIGKTANGKIVANLLVVTDESYNNIEQVKVEKYEKHKVVAWGRQAEIARQFLVKGSETMIEGRLKTRTWQDQQGQNRRTTEIIADRLQLGARPGGASAPAGGNNFANSPTPPQANNDSPFSDNTSTPEKNIPTIDLDEKTPTIKDEDLPF